ncbi:MAG: HAMP domain-containing histidine kinase [Proteobacteria bacterium]|nr:HAMP domain-containing histidine kinase [Pseudomonadota bacterium]
MQPILGTAELALNAARKAGDTCPPRVIQMLERMQYLVENYVVRATRLLDVTRIESGNLRLEPRPTDLSALVAAVAEKYRAPASRAGSVLKSAIEASVVGFVDPLATEQIVDNLLSNAIRFGAGKPIEVRLRAARGWALIEVQDEGVGMSSEQQARLFGRFEQVMHHRHGSGFGIGLWVAGRLALAMGGRISVQSEVGNGAAFTVELHTTKPDGAAS